MGLIPGFAQWVKDLALPVSCGVGHRHSWDLAFLWLWCRLAATVPIRPLAWELPYAKGVILKKKKKKKEEEERKKERKRKTNKQISKPRTSTGKAERGKEGGCRTAFSRKHFSIPRTQLKPCSSYHFLFATKIYSPQSRLPPFFKQPHPV